MFSNLQKKYAALTPREQRLIVATLLMGLSAAWYTLFYDPVVQEQAELRHQLIDMETQLAAQQQTAGQLEKRKAHDPDLNTKNQLLELQAQYQRLQEQVQSLNKKFVPPELMAKALSDLLKQNKQLNLIKLETLPVQQQQLIYQHGLVLHFSGSYLATLNYLKSLEAMPWNFIWDSIDYQVKDYPVAEITLRVHTLSLEKSWLNV